MTQCERLKKYLKLHKKIDPITAWEVLGIYRLGARIFDLRQRGMDITSSVKKVKNRFGEECRVALYKYGR